MSSKPQSIKSECSLELLGMSGVLQSESFLESGKKKGLHYVLKNAPFFVDLRLHSTGSSPIDFVRAPVKATLLYDMPDDVEREVTRVRVPPMKYKGTINPTDATRCRLEVFICILSSQHEDMNFRLRIDAVDTTTKQQPLGLSVYSQSLQVISKPGVLDNLKKNPRGAKRNGVIGQKRARSSESVLTRLKALETQQQEALQLLRAMHRAPQPSSPPALPSSSPLSPLSAMSIPEDLRQLMLAPREDRFHILFEMVVSEYVDTPEADRASKVRKTVARLAASDKGVQASECTSHLNAAFMEDNARTFGNPFGMLAGETPENLDEVLYSYCAAIENEGSFGHSMAGV